MAVRFTKYLCLSPKTFWGVILLALPSAAYADSGTPLLWTGFFHLVIGNLLIGCLEGALLSWFFKIGRMRAQFIMILANYVSMALGYILLHPVYSFLFQRGSHTAPLYKVPWVIGEMWAILFLITVIIEWPFCVWLMKGAKRIARRSLTASLLAQLASYSILIPVYLSVSHLNLYKNLHTDPSLASSIPLQGSIYYLTPDAKKIGVIDLKGANPQEVLTKDHGQYDGKLCLRKEGGREQWNLLLRDDMDAYTLLISGITGHATGHEKEDHYRYPAIDLRGPGNHDWAVLACRNPFDNGVSAQNSQTGDKIETFIESPFTFWGSYQPTVLPGDRVIFELSGQIVIMDLNRHTIGFITYGHSPVVILKDTAN